MEAGLEDIEDYTTRRHNTVPKYIATRLIMDLCKWSFWRPGVWVSRRWWEKEGLELEGTKEISAEELEGEEEKCKEDGMAQEKTKVPERGRGVLSSNLTQ